MHFELMQMETQYNKNYFIFLQHEIGAIEGNIDLEQ